MSFYRKLAKIGPQYISKSKLFKYGFNLSPMYRRTTARLIEVSKDLKLIKIKLPLSYKNSNYVGSIFGGSMFSAVDPIPMVQLMNILDDNRLIIWDKSANIKFKSPAKTDLYAEFSFTEQEINEIKQRIPKEKEILITKKTLLTDKSQEKVFCEVEKVIFIADKEHFKQTRAQKRK